LKHCVEHAHFVDQWWDTVGADRACESHNAHVDEEQKREQDACLLGIRCVDGYVIHCRDEEFRAWLLEGMTPSGPGRRVPAALLARDMPGGEWMESPLA